MQKETVLKDKRGLKETKMSTGHFCTNGPTFPTARRKRCGDCTGCKAMECAKCKNCLDKPKWGGPGKLKRPCVQRTCSAMVLKVFNYECLTNSSFTG